MSSNGTSITQSITKLNGMSNYKTWIRGVRTVMQKEGSLPAITYRPRLKVGDDVKNLTDKAKKLHEKLLEAEDKNKAPTEDDLNLPTIELIISGTRRSPFSYHF